MLLKMMKPKKRFDEMSKRLSVISDKELKNWQQQADTQRILGHACKQELKLLDKIEEELERRGFVYMTDF